MQSLRRLLAVGALSFALPAAAYGQTHAIDQGSFRLGGSASFTSNGGEVDGESLDRSTRLTISPSFQYFIRPGVAVGGDVAISRIDEDGETVTSYGIGPSFTYFFGAEAAGRRDWFPYIGAGVRYIRTDLGDDALLETEDPKATGFNASAGVLLFLSSAVGLTGELFYDRTDLENTSAVDVRTDTFGFAVGVSAFVF